jgi:cell division initiation protein
VPLTVKDILEKTFKRSFKGYDEDEVDKFLDQIIDEFKLLQNEVASLKAELAEAKEHVGKVKHTEETIMNTLVSAQKTSERMINEAKRKAEVIISSAEATAKQKAEQTLRELDEAKSKIEELKSCAQGFATSFANMVNAQAAYFEKTYKSYFGQDFMPLGGINTDALEKIDKEIARSLEEMGVSEKADEKPAPEEPDDDGDVSTENENTEEDETDKTDDKSGYMELFEINKMLSNIEDGDEPMQSSEDNDGVITAQQKYSDYSWLYESDGKTDDNDVAFKDPKGKEELKSLIDEIIE